MPAPVGAECADCHEDVVNSFATSEHARAWHFGTGAAGTCESCHKGAETHLESNDPDDILTPKEMSADEAAGICLNCHKENAAQAHWKGSTHQRRGVTCIDCHSVHEAPPPDSMVNTSLRRDTCYECHKDVRSEMQKVSHHPVREGKMTCVSCHDPHGTLTKGNLKAVSANELCYDCHTEKRGPFLWEHPPVRENCLNCHTPHGSNHLKLQSTSVPYLCQQCHVNTRHPGTLYDATVLPTLDDDTGGSNRIFNRACVDCHAAIHGSNHPSSPYLGH
ncbi:MAG: DmsE family decaheme c-type cytochrome [Acidobacteria bacterium]|nr:DmsE family decaheme c-type cytochrome [Acidobacteriota bacterium]